MKPNSDIVDLTFDDDRLAALTETHNAFRLMVEQGIQSRISLRNAAIRHMRAPLKPGESTLETSFTHAAVTILQPANDRPRQHNVPSTKDGPAMMSAGIQRHRHQFQPSHKSTLRSGISDIATTVVKAHAVDCPDRQAALMLDTVRFADGIRTVLDKFVTLEHLNDPQRLSLPLMRRAAKAKPAEAGTPQEDKTKDGAAQEPPPMSRGEVLLRDHVLVPCKAEADAITNFLERQTRQVDSSALTVRDIADACFASYETLVPDSRRRGVLGKRAYWHDVIEDAIEATRAAQFAIHNGNDAESPREKATHARMATYHRSTAWKAVAALVETAITDCSIDRFDQSLQESAFYRPAARLQVICQDGSLPNYARRVAHIASHQPPPTLGAVLPKKSRQPLLIPSELD
jgi:hypothetical protein